MVGNIIETDSCSRQQAYLEGRFQEQSVAEPAKGGNKTGQIVSGYYEGRLTGTASKVQLHPVATPGGSKWTPGVTCTRICLAPAAIVK